MDIINVISTKSAASEVTGGLLFYKSWHINAIFGLMDEPTGLKSGIEYFYLAYVMTTKPVTSEVTLYSNHVI